MSATLTTVETLTRYILNDISKTGSDIFTYENSSVFTITESNTTDVLSVFKNDIELESGDWSYNSSNNKVTVSVSCTSGDTIEIQYTYYQNYSSNELQAYTRAAIVQISNNNYKTWIIQNSSIYPDPEENEINLIATVTAILADPPQQSLRLPDITINFPNELNAYDKISKVISILKRNTTGVFNVL